MKLKILSPFRAAVGILAASVCFASVSHAVMIVPDDIGENITNSGGSLVGDVALGDIGNNSPGTLFAWLGTQVTGYNAIPGPSAPLPDPSGLSLIVNDDSASIGPYSLSGTFYAVLHYGKGNGGIGQGGGVVAYYFDNVPLDDYDFVTTGLGPNGLGGLSSVRIWGEKVPDGGVTLALLGATLVGLSVVRRRVRC